MWTSPRDQDSGGTRHGGTPHFGEFYLLELYQVLTVKIKVLFYFQQGERKRNHFEIQQSTLLVNKAFPQKIVNQSLSYLGEGKYPTPAPSSYLVPQDRDRELGNT